MSPSVSNRPDEPTARGGCHHPLVFPMTRLTHKATQGVSGKREIKSRSTRPQNVPFTVPFCLPRTGNEPQRQLETGELVWPLLPHFRAPARHWEGRDLLAGPSHGELLALAGSRDQGTSGESWLRRGPRAAGSPPGPSCRGCGLEKGSDSPISCVPPLPITLGSPGNAWGEKSHHPSLSTRPWMRR